MPLFTSIIPAFLSICFFHQRVEKGRIVKYVVSIYDILLVVLHLYYVTGSYDAEKFHCTG